MFKSAAKRAIFLTLTLLSMLIACSSPQATPPSATAPSSTGSSTVTATPSSTFQLNIADNPWPGYSGQYVAMAKDFFKAEGLNVKENFFQAGSDSDTAFLAGRVDIGWTTGAS